MRLCVLVGLGLLLGAPLPAAAQRLWLGGSLQRDAQRFPADVVPTRLDGSAIGWSVGAEALLWRHLALVVEWCDAGVIKDVQTTTLDVNGRTVAVTSTFSHRTRALAALGGFGHRVTARVRMAYLMGISTSEVRREFSSNAAGTVLVPPSDPTASSPALVDRFRAAIVGVEALVRLMPHVHAVAGVRAQPIALDPNPTGWSVRMFGGVGWVFP